MPMSVRQGSQSYSDATCDSNSSADAMNVVSGHGGRSCFWGPSEMHNRDLVLALSDDIVVRQRLGNHAPWPAMQSMPQSGFSPQFRSPATTSMGTTLRRLQERHVPWRENRTANPGPPTNVAWAERWACSATYNDVSEVPVRSRPAQAGHAILSRAESRVPTGPSRPRLARFAPNRPRCRPA